MSFSTFIYSIDNGFGVISVYKKGSKVSLQIECY